MYKFRFNIKRITLWILLSVQILLVISYIIPFLLLDDNIKQHIGNKISFIDSNNNYEKHTQSYHTITSRIILKNISARNRFIDFNSSLCYKNGTDLKAMNRTKEQNWQCVCLPGWHGVDCGQPEVIWRALLTYRKQLKIKGPKLFERRIIYAFKVDRLSENLIDIRLNELGDVIDLFVLYEEENANYFEHKLNNSLHKNYHRKILYLNNNFKNLFRVIASTVKNLRTDDVIITSDSNEIFNKLVLGFLKCYDGWPEPIQFRLRWSVYGFFWIHPSRTILKGGASTVYYLKNFINSNVQVLKDNVTATFKGIIVGDLNHVGGWYCEYCNDVAPIIEQLADDYKTKPIKWENVKEKIDNTYIEDLIENGLYIDGKTELKRARAYADNYFAPSYVKNNWNYYFLLSNLYSKLDYEEE